MQKYVAQSGEAVVISSHPVEVNGNVSQLMDVPEDYEGKHIFLEDGKVKVKNYPPSPENPLRKGLKAKLMNGTATPDDINEILKILL